MGILLCTSRTLDVFFALVSTCDAVGSLEGCSVLGCLFLVSWDVIGSLDWKGW